MRDRIIQLQESAEELGFGTIQQALDAGYHEVQDLVKGEFKLEKVEDLTNQAYREVHEAWEKEKQQVLDELTDVINDGELDWGEIVRKVEHALEFVEGCHE